MDTKQTQEDILNQLKDLHKRPGESLRERKRLFKKLENRAYCSAIITDAIEQGKNLTPYE
jgi:hypothetical protein